MAKKKQAELILNMKPGEAQLVHIQLKELKGKGASNTKNTELRVYKQPPKELPTGVYQNDCGRYYAQVAVDKIYYQLGIFDSIEDAHACYKEYKTKAIQEKCTGEKIVDWEAFRLENKAKKFTLPTPDENIKHKYIYPTKSNTYQVKIQADAKNKKCLGTFNTLDEAIQVRDAYMKENLPDVSLLSLKDKKNLPPPDLSVKEKYITPTKQNTYQVRIECIEGRPTVGTFETIEKAIAARDKYLEDHKDEIIKKKRK